MKRWHRNAHLREEKDTRLKNGTGRELALRGRKIPDYGKYIYQGLERRFWCLRTEGMRGEMLRRSRVGQQKQAGTRSHRALKAIPRRSDSFFKLHLKEMERVTVSKPHD